VNLWPSLGMRSNFLPPPFHRKPRLKARILPRFRISFDGARTNQNKEFQPARLRIRHGTSLATARDTCAAVGVWEMSGQKETEHASPSARQHQTNGGSSKGFDAFFFFPCFLPSSGPLLGPRPAYGTNALQFRILSAKFTDPGGALA